MTSSIKPEAHGEEDLRCRSFRRRTANTHLSSVVLKLFSFFRAFVNKSSTTISSQPCATPTKTCVYRTPADTIQRTEVTDHECTRTDNAAIMFAPSAALQLSQQVSAAAAAADRPARRAQRRSNMVGRVQRAPECSGPEFQAN